MNFKQNTFRVSVILLSILLGHFDVAAGDKKVLIYYSDILLVLFTCILLSGFLIRNRIGSGIKLPLEMHEMKIWFWLTALLIATTAFGTIQRDVYWTRGLIQLKIYLMSFLTYIITIVSLRNYRDVRSAINALIIFAFLLSMSIILLPFWKLISYDDMLRNKHLVSTSVGNSNYLGAFLGMMIPFIVSRIVASRNISRLLYIVILTITSVALLFTQSKTAFFCITLMSAAYIVFIYQGSLQRKTKLIAFGGVIILSLIFMNLDLVSGIYNKSINSFRELQAISFLSLQKSDVGDTLISRVYLWKVGLNIFIEHPILGAGLSSTSTVLDSIFNTKWSGVHNLIVELLAETGIAGTFLFILLLHTIYTKIKKLKASVSLSPNDENGNNRELVHGLSLAFLVALVNSLLEPTILTSSYSVLFWVVCGIIHVLNAGSYFEDERVSQY